MSAALRVVGATLVMGVFLIACAPSRKSLEPASPSGGSGGGASSDALSSPQQHPLAPAGAAPPPAAAAPSPPRPAAATPTDAFDYAKPPNRALALTHAGREIEASQRELDVAGGDCRNACLALGSMDRAAGRLCGLAQSSDELQRCGDAKTRVYSAREKVRGSCGTCPEITVERGAPIPSR